MALMGYEDSDSTTLNSRIWEVGDEMCKQTDQTMPVRRRPAICSKGAAVSLFSLATGV